MGYSTAKRVNVIGGGLAGCEAAWALANRGARVVLYDMKPYKRSPAHQTNKLCELVCSNSLKSSNVESAAGLLKEEMRMLGSITMRAAARTAVSAGGALAVDREKFSRYVTEAITTHPNIEFVPEEIKDFSLVKKHVTIIATGPLTSDALAWEIGDLFGKQLSFYDAAAPIVKRDSLDMDKIFAASRYSKGDDDYLNCPFNEEEYEKFYSELVNAESVKLKGFEKRSPNVYEGCMPIEIMAKRGKDTIRFGPLKPVGLKDPRTGKRPWAVVQLRKENIEGSLLNLVGFQTNLKFGEQQRVFSMIPGLENAEFVRYGVMHRNTFINSPAILTPYLNTRLCNNLFFAGQITGVEGYIESAASGIFAGINAYRKSIGEDLIAMPKQTMLGSLISYITDQSIVRNFQPMGCNMGILPEFGKEADEIIRSKEERNRLYVNRSMYHLRRFISEEDEIF